MKRLALLLVVVACSKTEKPAPAKQPQPQAPHVQEGDMAAKFDPKNLPPPGTAPAPVPVTHELDSIWNIPLKTVKGQDVKLADFKGKEILVVNVASQCGNTPQYAVLEALQKKYEPKGFTVLGFPCNQFGELEPGTSEEIATFCATNYGITFPIMEKIEVNGPNRSDIYKALTPISDAGGHSGDIRWNFEKFVVSADGTKVTRFAPKTQPDDPKVIAAIENGLPR
ncbi:MAG TPA: glutathione peroxidase [Kofleriaceae bacterium]|nr:glutathione peroxidase [Kofleriaceae bacterium]